MKSEMDEPVKRDGIKNWWLEIDEKGECWRIEVRDDGGIFAVVFTRPITVEWRIR